jgi:hypothetical protein
MLRCPYCNDKLKNASFSQSGMFVYLACVDCYNRVILMKEEYNKYIKVEESNNNKLKRWLE